MKDYKTLAVFLDAKRDKLYARSYRYHKNRWKPTGTIRVCSLREVAEFVDRGSWIAGNGILARGQGQAHDLYKFLKEISASPCRPFKNEIRGQGQAITQCLFPHLHVLPENFWHPKASTLIEWFEKKDPMLKPLTKPKELLPVYFRSSEAEEKLKDKKQ